MCMLDFQTLIFVSTNWNVFSNLAIYMNESKYIFYMYGRQLQYSQRP